MRLAPSMISTSLLAVILASVMGALTPDVDWHPNLEDAKRTAAEAGTLVLVAVHSADEARSEACLAETYRAAEVQDEFGRAACVLALTGEPDRSSLRRYGDRDLDQNRSLVRVLRDGLLRENDEGSIASPQHLWLTSDGRLLLSVPFEINADEMLWCFHQARRLAGLETTELSRDARAPRRLLLGETYVPARGEELGRGLTPEELDEELAKHKASGLGGGFGGGVGGGPGGAGAGGGAGGWMRVLGSVKRIARTDEKEARRWLSTELGSAFLDWDGGAALRWALSVVGLHGSPDSVELAEDFIKHREAGVRAQAAVLVEQLGSRDGLKIARKALAKEKDANVRAAWMRAVGASGRGERSARTLLEKELKRTDEPLVRRAILLGLGHLGPDEGAAALLAEHLAGSDPEMSMAAACGMALSRDETYLPLLRAALEQASDESRKKHLEDCIAVSSGEPILRIREAVEAVADDGIERPRLFFEARGEALVYRRQGRGAGRGPGGEGTGGEDSEPGAGGDGGRR